MKTVFSIYNVTIKIILILVLFPELELDAQILVNSNKLWSTMKGPVENCNSFYCESYYTKFTDDTTFNQLVYKKVLQSTDSEMNSWTLKGLIRESDQKVYFKSIDSQSECLLYDFSCSVGDIINLNCSCTGSGYKVDSIKTETILESQRKIYYLTYLQNQSKEYWIEGIGSNFGILNGGSFTHCITGGSELLLCCHENDTKIYQAFDKNHCYLSVDIVNSTDTQISNDEDAFLIYPIPATSQIQLKSEEFLFDDYIINVIASNGQTIQTKCIDKNTVNMINISNLPPGTYFLNIKSESKSIVRQIIIK